MYKNDNHINIKYHENHCLHNHNNHNHHIRNNNHLKK